MSLEKVIFAFFILLALTLNFGFFLGDIENPNHHHVYELYAAIVISIIATIMKLGDRSHLGSILLATSLVADFHLIAAAMVWAYAEHVSVSGINPELMSTIVSLSGGALLANVTSVVLFVAEAIVIRR